MQTLMYYQDWRKFFDSHLEKNLTDEEILFLKNSTFIDSNMISDYKNELIEFVNKYLTKQFNYSNRRISLSFETGDIQSLEYELKKISREIVKLSFIKDLKFLEKSFIDELYSSFKNNILAYYQFLLDKVDDNGDSFHFEVSYLIKKVRNEVLNRV